MKQYISKKPRITGILLVFFTLMMGSIFLSCEKDDNNGAPVINYIRVTDPLKSDSLVVRAFMGSNIALIGNNLENVKEIWFNDQKAALNPNFITDEVIIVNIPDVIPTVVTNEIKIVLGDNSEHKFPFNVDVPAPQVSSMLCEYVKDGDIAVIQGNFFINDPSSPLKVIFPGNIEGTITESKIDEIKVKVPAGSGIGPVQVKSIYGSTRSKFYFRDDRNIILNFDDLTASGGWRSGNVANSNPAPLSGNYVRFDGNMPGKGTWNEDAFSFNYWPGKQNRPKLNFSGDIASYAIKFECYVVEPWQASALQMIFTKYDVWDTNGYIGDGNQPRGLWIPWKNTGTYITEGWTTVTVPLSQFKYKPDGGTCSVPLSSEMIEGLTFFVWNGGVEGKDGRVHMCIDNIRIVPIK